MTPTLPLFIEKPLAQINQWLASHPNRTASPFHPLAGLLRHYAYECSSITPITCAEYVQSLYARTRGPGYSFRANSSSPELTCRSGELIEESIQRIDSTLLQHMIDADLMGLLSHLAARQEGCNFLDYGTGPQCGLHGLQHQHLYSNAGIDTSRVRFVGLDKFVMPANSVFPFSTYLKQDLTSYHTEVRFDLVTAHHVLEHIRDWKNLLSSASALLKPGGYAFFSYPAFGGFYDVMYRLLTHEDHIATYTAEEVIEAARFEGFELIRHAPYVDPHMKYFWLPTAEPSISAELQSAAYEISVFIASRTRMFLHHYGYYTILRKSI